MTEPTPELDTQSRAAVQRIRESFEPPTDLAAKLRPAVDARIATATEGAVGWTKAGLLALVVAVGVPAAVIGWPDAAVDVAPATVEPEAAETLAPAEPPPPATLPPSKAPATLTPPVTPDASALPRDAPAGSEPEDRLAAELALLSRAREALRIGDPDAALTLLARHERKFRRGALVDERDAARVLALCDAGRLEEATRRASEFARRRPDSHLLQRLRSSCAGNAIGKGG